MTELKQIKAFLNNTRRPEVDFLHHWRVVFVQMFGQMVFIGVEKLSNRSFSLSRNKKSNWKPASGRSQENEML